MRDKLLRPEIYKQYEEHLKILFADILIDVKNGRDLEDVRKAAYVKFINLSIRISTMTSKFRLITVTAIYQLLTQQCSPLQEN